MGSRHYSKVLAWCALCHIVVSEDMLLQNWDRVGQVGRKNDLCPENSSGVGAEAAG